MVVPSGAMSTLIQVPSVASKESSRTGPVWVSTVHAGCWAWTGLPNGTAARVHARMASSGRRAKILCRGSIRLPPCGHSASWITALRRVTGSVLKVRAVLGVRPEYQGTGNSAG